MCHNMIGGNHYNNLLCIVLHMILCNHSIQTCIHIHILLYMN